MIDDKVDFILFHLLRFQDHLGTIEPQEILQMWQTMNADDARILYHLRHAVPQGGPVPTEPGSSFAVERSSKGWPSPIALVVTDQGQRRHLNEAALVAAARRLMAFHCAPPPTRPPPGRVAVQMSLF